jgi:hypothetical protein
MDRLFAGRKKGVRVNVQDGLGPGGYGEGLIGHDWFSTKKTLKKNCQDISRKVAKTQRGKRLFRVSEATSG